MCSITKAPAPRNAESDTAEDVYKRQGVYQCLDHYGQVSGENENDYVTNDNDDFVLSGTER